MNLIDKLDKYLLIEKRRERRSHHPSDITSCMRQLYYKWNNIQSSDPPSAGNILKMRAGDWAEIILEKWLSYEVSQGGIDGYQQQAEVTAQPGDLEYPIHGYQDFIVHEDTCSYGIECKSSFGRGIKEIQQKGMPKEEHILQTYLYMVYYDMPLYYIIYIARDNGYRTQFELRLYGDKLYIDGKQYDIDLGYYLDRLKTAESTIGGEIAPDREYKAVVKDGEIKDKVQRDTVAYKSDWQCRYCNWRTRCWNKTIERSKTSKIFYGGEEI